MIETGIAIVEFIEANPILNSVMLTLCLVGIHLVHRDGRAGRQKLHDRIDGVCGELSAVKTDMARWHGWAEGKFGDGLPTTSKGGDD